MQLQQMDVATIGARIRELRKAKRWTQVDACHRSRMSIGDWSRIEGGRLIPSDSQLERVAAALDVTVEALVGA
jgi:transcriptional regulator with XRE-family HTH domain